MKNDTGMANAILVLMVAFLLIFLSIKYAFVMCFIIIPLGLTAIAGMFR